MSETHDRLVKALEETTLPEYELEKILFYVKVLVYSRRGRIIPAPTPEQWQSFPFWFQWKIFIIAMFWTKVYELQMSAFHLLRKAEKRDKANGKAS